MQVGKMGTHIGIAFIGTHDKFTGLRDGVAEPRQFLLNRALRIVPAYWFYTALMAMLLLACSQWMPHQAFTWPHLLLSLLFIPAENPGGYGLYPTLNVGWTLNYEMFFYLLFSLVFLVRQRHHLWLVALAFLCGFVVLSQSRGAALALLLAQAAYLAGQDGHWPVLQLDDLASELDRAHQARVLERLLNGPAQIFITATETPAALLDLTHIARFHVEHAQIVAVP